VRPSALDTHLGGLPFRDDVRQLLLADSLADNHHDFGRRRPERPRRAEGLANESFRAITLHGITDSP
jgi:hypothetical protein